MTTFSTLILVQGVSRCVEQLLLVQQPTPLLPRYPAQLLMP